MLGTTSLQPPTPKSGRSRFSKALPAPPSFLDEQELQSPNPPKSNLSNLSNLSSPTSASSRSLLPDLPQLPPLPTLDVQLDSEPFAPFQSKALPPIILPESEQQRPLPPPKQADSSNWNSYSNNYAYSSTSSSTKETKPDMATTAKPFSPYNSPLPALPAKAGHFPPAPAPATIVKRRPVPSPSVASPPPPVASSSSPSTTTTPASNLPVVSVAPAPPPPASASNPAPIQIPAPHLASPDPSPSPALSYSSLLSAYNTDPTPESTPRSSTNLTTDKSGTADEKQFIASASQSVQQAGTLSIGPSLTTQSTLLSDQNAQNRAQEGSNKPISDEQESRPPPPVKNPQPAQSPLRPKTPDAVKLQIQSGQGSTTTNATASPTNTSPQQDQLWRRRSLKSDNNLEVPDLKLVSSNGSTAGSAQNTSHSSSSNAQSSPPRPEGNQSDSTQSAARTRVILPKTTNASLPGRNIRPVASQQQIASQDEEKMGQKVSHLKAKLSDHPSDGTEKSPHEERPGLPAKLTKPLPNPVASPTVGRLPTPEYEKNDIKSSIVETVVSPVSPASSPELASETKSVIQRKAVGGGGTKVNNVGLPGRPTAGLPATPAANRARAPSQPQQFSARSTSITGNDQRPTDLTVQKQWELQPHPVVDELKAGSDTGSIDSDATVRVRPYDNASVIAPSLTLTVPPVNEADEEESTTDHPGAALFPRNWYRREVGVKILDAAPLTDKHYRCLTNHRYMTANKQRYNPIACRTCGNKDRNADCFICSACSLNICPTCNGNLRRFRGDLKQLLRVIKESKSAPVAGDNESTTDTIRPGGVGTNNVMRVSS